MAVVRPAAVGASAEFSGAAMHARHLGSPSVLEPINALVFVNHLVMFLVLSSGSV